MTNRIITPEKMFSDTGQMLEDAFALRLAELLDCSVVVSDQQAAAELRRLHEENKRLRTVMVAAAEEIAEHWEAHCDADGYGPANLMHRLESGIAAEYGYTAGEFARLRAQRDALLEALKLALSSHGLMLLSDPPQEAWKAYQVEAKARAAIAKAEGEKA